MEINGQGTSRELVKQNLKNSLEISTSKKSDFEISIYSGELTNEITQIGMLKAKSAFPALPNNFFLTLTDRIIANGFSDKRLIDAVNHVIDNHVYPEPSIAEFISFDRKIKLYSHQDILKLVEEFGAVVWGDYESKKLSISGGMKTVWISKLELKKYNIDIETLK